MVINLSNLAWIIAIVLNLALFMHHMRTVRRMEDELELIYDERDTKADLLHEQIKHSDKLSEKLKSGIEDQDRLKDEIEHLNKVIATLKVELNKAKQSADSRIDLNNKLRDELGSMAGTILKLRSDIESLNKTIKEMQVKAERDKKHFEETCQMLNDFGKEINRLNESVAEKDRIIKELNECINEDKKDFYEKCQELSDHSHEIDRLNEINAELDKSVSQLKYGNERLQHCLLDAEYHRNDLARRLGETTAINTNLKELAIHCQNFLSVWREETDKAFSTLQNHVKQGLESQLITTNEPVQQSQENVDATQQGI